MSMTALPGVMHRCIMLNRADLKMRHCGILLCRVKGFTCLAAGCPASTSVPQVEQALCPQSRLLFIAARRLHALLSKIVSKSQQV